MRILLIFSIFCELVVLIHSSFEQIEECVGKSMLSKRKTKSSTMLSLMYGDSSFEVFNTISTNDLKRIDLLAQCVQRENGFNASSREQGFHSGSITTDLTDIFDALIPSVMDTITSSIEYGFKKNKNKFDRKPLDFSKVSIKSIRHLYINEGKMSEFAEHINKLKEADAAARDMFIIVPTEVRKENERLEALRVDPDSDEFMEQHVTRDVTDVDYYVVIPLNDRSDYVGGELLVRKESNKPSLISKQKSVSNGNDDSEEEEEADEQQVDRMNLKSSIASKRPKYSVFTRMTPDKGSILVVQGCYDVGIKPVTHGERRALLIEYKEDVNKKSGNKYDL